MSGPQLAASAPDVPRPRMPSIRLPVRPPTSGWGDRAPPRREQPHVDDLGPEVERRKDETLRSASRRKRSQVERQGLKALIHAAVGAISRDELERQQHQDWPKKEPGGNPETGQTLADRKMVECRRLEWCVVIRVDADQMQPQMLVGVIMHPQINGLQSATSKGDAEKAFALDRIGDRRRDLRDRAVLRFARAKNDRNVGSGSYRTVNRRRRRFPIPSARIERSLAETDARSGRTDVMLRVSIKSYIADRFSNRRNSFKRSVLSNQPRAVTRFPSMTTGRSTKVAPACVASSAAFGDRGDRPVSDAIRRGDDLDTVADRRHGSIRLKEPPRDSQQVGIVAEILRSPSARTKETGIFVRTHIAKGDVGYQVVAGGSWVMSQPGGCSCITR